MIPIEKSNPFEVEKICLELYKKMNFRNYPEFKNDLNSWVASNVPKLAREKDAFLKIMTGEYSFLLRILQSLLLAPLYCHEYLIKLQFYGS